MFDQRLQVATALFPQFLQKLPPDDTGKQSLSIDFNLLFEVTDQLISVHIATFKIGPRAVSTTGDSASAEPRPVLE